MTALLYILTFLCYVAGGAVAWVYSFDVLLSQQQKRARTYGFVLHLLALLVAAALIYNRLHPAP